MIEVYSVELIPLEGTDQLWLTVDYPCDKGGMKSDVLAKFTDKEKAKAALKEARKKVKIIHNPYLPDSCATTKDERKFISDCIKNKKDYKQTILKKRIKSNT